MRLAHRAGLPTSTGDETLSNALRRRTADWARNGLYLRLDLAHLEFEAEELPEAELTVTAGNPRDFQRRLIDALTRTALDIAQSHTETRSALRDLRALSHELAELTATLKQEPPSIARTEHMAPTLSWAKSHLTTVRKTVRETLQDTRILLAIIEEAANTLPHRRRRKPSSAAKRSTPKLRKARSPRRTGTTAPPPRPSRPAASKAPVTKGPEDFQP